MAGSPTVLIVEDEDLVRMVGCEILHEHGYTVLEASNAAEALKCLEEGAEVRVLFTDVHMPGTPDGLGLAKLVHERWPTVKLLVASGQARPQAAELPQDGRFLSKPYRAADLIALIQALSED